MTALAEVQGKGAAPSRSLPPAQRSPAAGGAGAASQDREPFVDVFGSVLVRTEAAARGKDSRSGAGPRRAAGVGQPERAASMRARARKPQAGEQTVPTARSQGAEGAPPAPARPQVEGEAPGSDVNRDERCDAAAAHGARLRAEDAGRDRDPGNRETSQGAEDAQAASLHGAPSRGGSGPGPGGSASSPTADEQADPAGARPAQGLEPGLPSADETLAPDSLPGQDAAGNVGASGLDATEAEGASFAAAGTDAGSGEGAPDAPRAGARTDPGNSGEPLPAGSSPGADGETLSAAETRARAALWGARPDLRSEPAAQIGPAGPRPRGEKKLASAAPGGPLPAGDAAAGFRLAPSAAEDAARSGVESASAAAGGGERAESLRAPGAEAGKAGAEPAAEPARAPVLDLAEGRERWVERLAQALRSQLRSGTSQLRMHLRPPQLGPLDLKLSLRGAALKLSIDVESNAARHILSSGVAELRESLRGAGIDVEGIRIALAEREERPAPQGDGRGPGAEARGRPRGETAGREGSAGSEPLEPAGASATGAAAVINVQA